jgi:hypothetical protein
MLNKNIWKNFEHNGILKKKDLNTEEKEEYDKIKKLSEQLIIDNFNRNPTFLYIAKTCNGYTIARICPILRKQDCLWYIKINLNTNKAILTCNKDCHHTNPKKNKSIIKI